MMIATLMISIVAGATMVSAKNVYIRGAAVISWALFMLASTWWGA